MAEFGKNRISCDSPSVMSMSWRDGRDDAESIRGADDMEFMGIPDEKVKKFDELLRRIETEREKIAEEESKPEPSRQSGAFATPRRADRGNTSSASPGSANYDFASRARQLRMSLDCAPLRSATPATHSERGSSKEGHFAQLARDMTPGRSASPSPMISRMSYDDIPSKRSESRDDSPSVRSHRPRDVPRRNASNTPIRKSSPNTNQVDFKLQVEKFHRSLVSAHDTIAALEKDIRHLNRRVDEKDTCIASLEKRNKSLNDNLAKSRTEINKVGAEKNDLNADQIATNRRHSEELEKLRTECKEQSSQAEKLSAESDAKVEAAELDKKKFEASTQDKDNMIASLRNEIQRLNEELADGSFVRSQAKKSEDTAKKLEAELEEFKTDHAATNTVIADLEIRLKERSDECNRKLELKDKEIATLKSEMLGGASLRQTQDKISTLKSDLAESEMKNEELTEKVGDLERRTERAEQAGKRKDEDMRKLDAVAHNSAALKRQLEDKHRELERQHERLEKYDVDCAREQETVAALEKAIEDLEIAHNESNTDITRLQEENRSLSSTLKEAEEYMKLYQQDMKDARKIKSIVGELQDTNNELSEKAKSREEEILKKETRINSLRDRIVTLEMEAESKNVSVNHAIVQLENKLSTKQQEVSKLQDEISSMRESQARDRITATKLIKLAAELSQLQTDKSRLIINEKFLTNEVKDHQRRICELENDLASATSRSLGAKLDEECQVEKLQKEAKRAWVRAGELEESLTLLQSKLSRAEKQVSNAPSIEHLEQEISSLKQHLHERDEQLTESRKGIAEAQKMIFRLMNTVQELRKKAKGVEPIASFE